LHKQTINLIMKKSIIFLSMGIFLSLASLSNAQKFWREDWKGSTAQGQLTYTGPNGAWTTAASGANGADGNVWYFSNWEEGLDSGQCGAGQVGPATAHMGFTTNSPLMWPVYQALNGATNPDQGAVIDDDSPQPTNTNLRLESPVITCAGRTGIVLSFNYIEGKADGSTAEATVVYSANGGGSWSTIATPPELDSCGNGEGHWTHYSVALPATANNNTNVKIGFNWTNGMLEREDSIFDNYFTPVVSFAVDSIVLAVPPPVANFSANDTLICVGDTVEFTDLSTNSPTHWKWYFHNGNPATSTKQDTNVIYNTPGTDSVKLVVSNGGGSDSVTVKKCIHVLAKPAPTFAGSGHDTVCKGSIASITATGGTKYLWSNGATTSTVTFTANADTTYCVSVGNGACSKDTCRRVYVKTCAGVEDIMDQDNISIYPNPANNTVNLEFTKAISGNAKIEISDITGRLVSTQVLSASEGKTIPIDISSMAAGMYIMKVTTGTNVYFDKFIKQ
jgi:PKD repeat protein